MSFASILMGAWRKAQADARQLDRANASVAVFNARWQKLNGIRGDVTERFVKPLVHRTLSAGDGQRLNLDLQEVDGWANAIANNINAAKAAHLSRYATCLKRLALRSIKLCKKYNVYSNITSVTFLTYNKMLVLNGQNLYCFD
jgi:hypothetical protein